MHLYVASVAVSQRSSCGQRLSVLRLALDPREAELA